MGRDNSNAGQRVLQARSYLRGADDSLANIIGVGLPDGAMCYVVEKQANYRFVRGSALAPDDHDVVVEPVGGGGRWVRESGTIGFALLSNGVPDAPEQSQVTNIVRYAKAQLVQFALEAETGIAIYTGAVARLAAVITDVQGGVPLVALNQGDGTWASVFGVIELRTGFGVRLSAGNPTPDLRASMQIILL